MPDVGTLQADDHPAIRAAVGSVMAVQGKVSFVGQTRSGSMFFINFSGNPRGEFLGIVKKENCEAVVGALGADLKSALAGRNIELRGEIVLYKEIPEIIITDGSQLKVIQ